MKVKVNKDSMLYWYPQIKDLDLLMPKTEMIVIPTKKLIKLINNKEDTERFLSEYKEKILERAKKIGYPLFMRTDQMACKHDWKNTCYVPSEKDLINHLFRLVDGNFCVDMFGEAEPNAIVFREFLELDWSFKAFADMPIAREFRFFIRDGTVECRHPYWPPNAIRRPSIDDWLDILRKQSILKPSEKTLLDNYSKTIGNVLSGYWSVDYCRTREGLWYLTDMALGEQSYHWSTCDKAPKEMLDHYGDPEKLERVE